MYNAYNEHCERTDPLMDRTNNNDKSRDIQICMAVELGSVKPHVNGSLWIDSLVKYKIYIAYNGVQVSFVVVVV